MCFWLWYSHWFILLPCSSSAYSIYLLRKNIANSRVWRIREFEPCRFSFTGETLKCSLRQLHQASSRGDVKRDALSLQVQQPLMRDIFSHRKAMADRYLAVYYPGRASITYAIVVWERSAKRLPDHLLWRSLIHYCDTVGGAYSSFLRYFDQSQQISPRF